jgi:glycosyltransferase involved in cell wall biosynthesis
MSKLNRVKDVAFLSTYPPRECGLATFTEDLVNEITKAGQVRAHVIAVAKGAEEYEDPRVAYILSQHDRSSYFKTAQWANTHVDLLVIEHEYGIFGGEYGSYILDMARGLTIPFIVTTHTVLLEPLPEQRAILRDLGRLSSKVVTMARSSIPILAGTYGIAPEKLAFIPHGVPDMQVESRAKLKIAHGLRDKKVISSFGLISPAKGLEYGIEALAKVVPDYKNLVYLILGKTHPCVKESMGESYRQSLVDLAQSLGVQDNVRFIDKYLTKQEVITYLRLSDVYLTPYLSKEQAVSGTLAYAMGCGRVIVSTPYRYAVEMLGGGRGLLAGFKDSESMAACIRTVLGNPTKKAAMEQKTLAVGQTMLWATVAAQYVELGLSIIEDAGNRAQQGAWRLMRPPVAISQPQLVLAGRREMGARV